MSGAGALAAIMAAAHAQRMQEVTDAFRLAGATAPERARSLGALGVAHPAEAAELAKAGVLLPGATPDTWYLSEAAVLARRRAGARRGAWVVAAALLVTVGLVAIAVLLRMSRRS